MFNFTDEPIAYFHGRFQPFHFGHLSVVKHALQSCRQLAIGISNPFRLPAVVPAEFSDAAQASLLRARSPENNPWPYWARSLMIREALRQEGIDLERIMIIPNLNYMTLPIDEIRFPKGMTVVFVCPKDAHNKAASAKYQSEGWKVVEVPPGSMGVGSAAIRAKIRAKEDWESLVPTGAAQVIRALAEQTLIQI
jgi:cytidyltransferase-like protein